MREMDFVDECYADKDLSLLKKLTLVIPTYNRNYYLSRCLWYHAHFPFGEIIVADSSPEEKKVVNRETVQKVREMFGANVRYLEYEPETEKYGGDIYRKWGDAVQHVDTEYSIVCTDKAFRLPCALMKAITILDSDNTYVASNYGTFHFLSDHIDEEGKSTFILSDSFPSQTETDNNGVSRFVNSICTMGWGNGLMLSTWRSLELKRLYKPIILKRINDIRYGELHIAFSGHLLGKYYSSGNEIAAIRDVSHVNYDLKVSGSNKLGSSESSTSRYPFLYDYEYVGTKTGKSLLHAYKQEIINYLIQYSGMDEKEANILFDKKICNMIPVKYADFPMNKILIHLWLKIPYLSLIWKFLPDFHKKTINQIFRRKIMVNTQINDTTLNSSEILIICHLLEITYQLYNNDNSVMEFLTDI